MELHETNLLTQIRNNRDFLTPKQRVVGDFIMRNYRALAYVTLAELAKMAKTGQGTIVRFAETLGYKSFSGLQAALRDEIENMAPKTLDVFSSCYGKKGEQGALDTIFELEQSIMNETRMQIKTDEFSHAVEKLAFAPALVIVATGSNAFLAEYAGFFLKILRENVKVVKRFDIDDVQSLWDQPEGAVALLFSFPRYPKHTQSILELLVKKNIEVIGISDSIASPIVDRSNQFFVVPQKFLSFMDPYAAVVSLVHALLYGVYLSNRDNSRVRVNTYNEVLRSEKLFVRDDIDIPDLR